MGGWCGGVSEVLYSIKTYIDNSSKNNKKITTMTTKMPHETQKKYNKKTNTSTKPKQTIILTHE